MRLEWIEDILAVVKEGALNRAAEQRYLTQPAFSRRIRSIEEYLGVELIDRTHKPAQLRPEILEQQERLENLAFELRDLLNDLRQQDRKRDNRIVVASQHGVTATVVPMVLKRLLVNINTTVRLRSVNRAECFTLLATKQADLMVIYRMTDEQLPLRSSLLEECDFYHDELVPVFATESLTMLNDQYRQGEVPVITYPTEVFLGQVLNREIFPRLHPNLFLHTKAETALTLAGLQLAKAAIGVAWVPLSLALAEITADKLTDLSHLFGKAKLAVTAIRIAGAKSSVEQDAWKVITGFKEAGFT
jgi:DNA-binding transcriptional LysR family regulator